MAEKVVSPGVFTNEIDASFLPAALGDIGAVVIGPTFKGPAMIPTVINSMAEFEQTYGTVFRSGSENYQYLTSHTAEAYLKNGGPLTVVRTSDATPANASIFIQDSANTHTTAYSSGEANKCITFETIGDGYIYNNFGGVATTYTDHSGSSKIAGNVLVSGSTDNYQIEITGTNNSKGTFNLQVRSGGDTVKRKAVLESFNNVSLDPNSNNYVEKVIGNQDMSLQGTGTAEPYIKPAGEFPNKSKFIRVKTMHKLTPNYLTENGTVSDTTLSGSLPSAQSASFVGGANGITGTDGFGNVVTSSILEICLTILLISPSLSFASVVTSPVMNTFPCPPIVSTATLEFGSCSKHKSKIASDILSHILSGCRGDTNSAVLIIDYF